ncbi:hypothetical protein [Nonomuraea angiospora]|nr:hypothetical protein [Nonomuraea angiospora]MDX3103538.1 hypothetical protein [Nonomuraea angiospora]
MVRAAGEAARDWSAEHETHLFARRAQEFLAGLDPLSGHLAIENHG